MKGKIFNAQEVQAIIAGNKTMFREVIKPQPAEGFYPRRRKNRAGNDVWMEFKDTPESDRIWGGGIDRWKCPYQVGQKIFCKERFWIDGATGEFKWYYNSIFTADDIRGVRRKPAQHMKQEHSRLTLLIKEIRVERLASISEEDAIAEGFKNTFVGFQHPVYNPGRTANQDFEIFWNATHKKPEEKFEANPWVWVVGFKVINN